MDEGIRGDRDQTGCIAGVPGADVRLCREPVQGGSAALPGEGDVDGVFWAPGPAGWTGCL